MNLQGATFFIHPYRGYTVKLQDGSLITYDQYTQAKKDNIMKLFGIKQKE